MLEIWVGLAMVAAGLGAESGPDRAVISAGDEFRIKRETVFEFAQKPAVVRDGDKVTITFESKGLCDATVAVEDAGGKILRHLASGVLGPNAPEPFQKNARSQTLVWDGKDDQETYVDHPDAARVRVSLGLKPQFEKTLYWSPHKRLTVGKAIDADALRMCAAPEGVYVSDGTGVDSIRLFDHDGNYIRTLYPFPSDKLGQVQGVERKPLPQGGEPQPLGAGMMHATLLTSGSSADPENKYGYAANLLAIGGSRMAIGFNSLNRLATDGSSGGLPLQGPELAPEVRIGPEDMWAGGKMRRAAPYSAAFSPDGKQLYLSGYGWCGLLGRAQEWLGGITRLEFAANVAPQLFAGSLKQGDFGSGDGQFKWAVSVAVDAQGRVYAADHLNSRIQVFSPEGKFLKAIAVERPAFVGVHPKSGEIVVLSWRLGSDDPKLSPPVSTPRYTRLAGFDTPKVLATCPLTLLHGYDAARGGSSRLDGGGMQYAAAFDGWAGTPVIWLSPGRAEAPLLLVEKDGRLEVKRDFTKDAAKAVTRTAAPIIQRQRLYVNPASGRLYVGEGDSGVMKSFRQLVEIDPDTGRTRLVNLPFTTEDMAFDLEGMAYLRSDTHVARFDPASWREIPWDYGEERSAPGFDGDGARLNSTLALPATGRPGWFHLGGMAISARGHLAVACYNSATPSRPLDGSRPQANLEAGEKAHLRPANAGGAPKYMPQLYPGRPVGWETHIWDKHGKQVRVDATPGMPMSDGLGIDKDDNIYALAGPNRVLNGTPYPVATCETLIKFKPGAGRLLSTGANVPVPLAPEARPGRPADLQGNSFNLAGTGWAEGVAWMYGGVGLNNMVCGCWNARPALDYFARSFAPEINNHAVAVLDSNGNLILRVGRYGNVDEGVPLVREGGPATPRAIGGDEVSLVFGAYLATLSDRRLYIADAGNSRIVCVKLGYQAEERVALPAAATGR
jgi:hypothetical protein